MCATLCSLNRRILFSVFYVLPSGVINDDDDDDTHTETCEIQYLLLKE